MGKSAGEQLLQRVHVVVRAARLWDEFKMVEHFALSVENEPYMPLLIESWPAADPLQGERRHILVAHYSTGKGRKFPDPELEMTEYGFPVRLRQTVFGVIETPVLWRDPHTNEVLVNVSGKKSMAQLLRIWANNISEQGFVEAASRIITKNRPRAFLLAAAQERGGCANADASMIEQRREE